MSVSYWQDKSSTHPTDSADVIVIGAGIAGLSTAYWLGHEDPDIKVVVLEKYQHGAGASGRNAGFITCGSVEHFNRLVGKHGPEEALEMWRFSETNLALLKEHIIGHGPKEQEALMFEQKGSFSLASTDSELKELKKSAELMASMNIPVEILEEKAVASRLGAVNFVGGIKYIDDASIHPMRLLGQIHNTIKKRFKNIQLIENAEVHDITTSHDDKLVKTKVGHFKAPMVVMATNAYSPLLNSYFKDKIFPTRGQILATAPVARFMEGPCYANFVLDYFRQLPTGEMIIGGFRQLQKDSEVGYSDEITDVIQHSLEKFLKDHIPALKQTPITHRWSGIMGFAADGQPMVGSLPSDSQISYISACTGHGLGLSFHSAKTLVDSMMGRAIPKFISGKRFQ